MKITTLSAALLLASTTVLADKEFPISSLNTAALIADKREARHHEINIVSVVKRTADGPKGVNRHENQGKKGGKKHNEHGLEAHSDGERRYYEKDGEGKEVKGGGNVEEEEGVKNEKKGGKGDEKNGGSGKKGGGGDKKGAEGEKKGGAGDKGDAADKKGVDSSLHKYEWLVPNTVTPATDYSIHISHAGNVDTYSHYFEIVKAGDPQSNKPSV